MSDLCTRMYDCSKRGNLDILKWLRIEKNCSWNSDVIRCARKHKYNEIEKWALENGCPDYTT